jgi:hypothetical protein
MIEQVEMFPVALLGGPPEPKQLNGTIVTLRADFDINVRPRPVSYVYGLAKELLEPAGLSTQEIGNIVTKLIHIKGGYVQAFGVLAEACNAFDPLDYLRNCHAREHHDRVGTRLAEDWNPGPEGLKYARSFGFQDQQIDAMFEDFRDHFLAKAGAAARKASWPRTWKRWVRTCHERLRESELRQGQRQGRPAKRF